MLSTPNDPAATLMPHSTEREGRATRAFRAIRCFAWDLVDAGPEEVVSELREAGVDGLHLALAWHGGRFYCPHNPKRALVHAPDGVVYFRPSLERYGEIKPRVHPEYGSGALAASARELCLDYEMSFAAWVSLFNNATVTEWRPDVACVNALGDRIASAMCPSHPAVREYAHGLVEDLAREVEADVIELEDFGFPQLGSYAGMEWRGVAVGPSLAFLMGLCFCDHCRQRAGEMGVEIDDLKRRVARMIRQGLAGDLSERRLLDEMGEAGHPFVKFNAVRAKTIATLFDELVDAAEGTPALIQPVFSEDAGTAWHAGLELRELRQRIHGATVVAPAAPPEAARAFFEEYGGMLQLGSDMTADLRVTRFDRGPQAGAERDIPALIAAAREAGCERLILSHYGLASLEQLDWLLAAARQA